MYQEAKYTNDFLFKKAIFFVGTLTLFYVSLSIMDFANVLTFLQNAGVNVPAGLADALSLIGTVYGIQHYLIGLLSVTVPASIIGAAIAVGAFGL